MPEFNQPLGGNEMPRFAGPATMMRLPAKATAEGLDACFVGVPMDIGTSNRSGARFGPRAIRAESCMIRPYNMATRAAPFESLQVADIGDVAINTFNMVETIRIIEDAYDAILAHGLHAADPWRGPHAAAADPARDQEDPRAGRPDPRRRPRGRERAYVRRAHRPWHPVSPRHRGRPDRADPHGPDRAAGDRDMPPTISTGCANSAGGSFLPRNAGTAR